MVPYESEAHNRAVGAGILKTSQPKTPKPEVTRFESAWPEPEKVAMLVKTSSAASRRSQTSPRMFAMELMWSAVESWPNRNESEMSMVALMMVVRNMKLPVAAGRRCQWCCTSQ